MIMMDNFFFDLIQFILDLLQLEQNHDMGLFRIDAHRTGITCNFLFYFFILIRWYFLHGNFNS